MTEDTIEPRDVAKVVNTLVEATTMDNPLGVRFIKESDLVHALKPLIQRYASQEKYGAHTAKRQLLKQAEAYLLGMAWDKATLEGIDETCYAGCNISDLKEHNLL